MFLNFSGLSINISELYAIALTKACITMFMVIGVVSELTLADTATLVKCLLTRLDAYYHSPFLTKSVNLSQYS